MSQELKRTNRTQQTYDQEQRTDKYRRVATELIIGRRIGGRTNLWLTPSMLREAYRQHRARFEHPVSASVVHVRFQGPKAKEQAEQAAEAWQREDVDAHRLADRFPG